MATVQQEVIMTKLTWGRSLYGRILGLTRKTAAATKVTAAQKKPSKTKKPSLSKEESESES